MIKSLLTPQNVCQTHAKPTPPTFYLLRTPDLIDVRERKKGLLLRHGLSKRIPVVNAWSALKYAQAGICWRAEPFGRGVVGFPKGRNHKVDP